MFPKTRINGMYLGLIKDITRTTYATQVQSQPLQGIFGASSSSAESGTDAMQHGHMSHRSMGTPSTVFPSRSTVWWHREHVRMEHASKEKSSVWRPGFLMQMWPSMTCPWFEPNSFGSVMLNFSMQVSQTRYPSHSQHLGILWMRYFMLGSRLTCSIGSTSSSESSSEPNPPYVEDESPSSRADDGGDAQTLSVSWEEGDVAILLSEGLCTLMQTTFISTVFTGEMPLVRTTFSCGMLHAGIC